MEAIEIKIMFFILTDPGFIKNIEKGFSKCQYLFARVLDEILETIPEQKSLV